MRARLLLITAFSCFIPMAACGGGDDGDGGGGSTGASCVPTAAECYVSGPKGPGAECMAKSDNTGQSVWQSRITSIKVTKPAVLASQFVQVGVIDKGIDLALPNCYENGNGTFSWLFNLDSTTSKLRTGGSLPVTDTKAGGCFVTITDIPVPVAPIDATVTLDADKLGFSGTVDQVNVPIFKSALDITKPTILPLHKVALVAKFNDATHNCIGKFNGDQLDPAGSCLPDQKADPPQRAWTPGGTLKGYITVDEADQVFIDELGTTLCVLIAGLSTWNGPNKDCKSSTKWQSGERPDNIDWCSTTDQAADATCKDAWRLEGDFAAAAFKVNGDCP